jgi:hypothetical protein
MQDIVLRKETIEILVDRPDQAKNSAKKPTREPQVPAEMREFRVYRKVVGNERELCLGMSMAVGGIRSANSIFRASALLNIWWR